MEVEELCRKLRPILGKRADALWQAFLLEDPEGRREMAANIEILYAKLLVKNLTTDRILLFPPPENLAKGDYPIGKVVYNDKELYTFFLREDEIIQHCVILGRSGSGKTNTAYVIILGLLLKNKPFLILDWKRNYRDLWGILPEEKQKDILVFTVGRDISPLKFNPLIPPAATPPEMWLKKLIEIIAHAFYCGDGVMFLLQKAIDNVYKKFGVYEGTNKIWPTMQDVLAYLENYNAKGREVGWITSTLRAVATLCFGEMGRVLNVRERISLEQLLTKNVIMELDALTSSDKIFFIETLLLWIHHYRMAEPDREIFKHAILVEEAHHILLKEKQELKGGETIVDIILREIRELGEAIYLIDQVPSQMSNIALANSYTTIAMNLKHQSDVYSAARCMLLDVDQKDYLGILEVGYAICKLQGRIFKPFLLKIPLIKIKKGAITDAEIRQRMHGYFPSQNANHNGQIEEKEGRTDSSYSVSKPINQNQTNSRVFTDFSAKDKLDINEKKLLIDIANYKPTPTFTRYERLGFNPRLGNALKDALTNKGLINVESIPTSNARVKLMNITTKGKLLLQELGHRIKTETNGTEHRYWKNRIADYYRNKGYPVEIEKNEADIVVDNKIPIEIVTGKSDEINNIVRNLDKYNQSLSVAVNRQVRKKLIEDLRKANLLDDKRITIVDTRGYVK